MGSKFHCGVGFIKIIKAVAVMQRLLCVCLDPVDAQLTGVLGAAQSQRGQPKGSSERGQVLTLDIKSLNL